MSAFIYSKVTFAGDSIEIMTPKHADDAQHRHTIAYFEAFNELRRREADRVQEINSYIADQLRKPWKIYSRENPAGLTTGSSYMGNRRNWRPALPVEMWHAPKPLTPKQATTKRNKILRDVDSGEYLPKGQGYPNADQRPAFTQLDFEEIDS